MDETRDLYVIPNWNRDFETSRSRAIEKTRYLCIPNHFDGKKIRRLGKQGKKAAELYGIFHAIAAVASRCPCRGVLIDVDGPLTALDLEDKTIFDAKSFENALQILSEPRIGLLERFEVRRKDGIWELPALAAAGTADAAARTIPGAPWGALTAVRTAAGDVNGQKQNLPLGLPPERQQVPPERQQVPPERQQVTPERQPLPCIGEKGEDRKGESGSSRAPAQARQDGDEVLSYPEQHRILSEIAQKRFKRPVRAADWSNAEKQTWLSEAQPVTRGELEALQWFYGLAESHPALQRTQRRQSLEKLLECLRAEIDKATVAAQGARVFGAKKNLAADLPEPQGWREVFAEIFGPEVEIPANNFFELPKTAQAEIQVKLVQKKAAKK